LWSAFPAQTPYQYAYNSPLTYRDPSGLAPEKEKEGEELMGDQENPVERAECGYEILARNQDETNRGGVEDGAPEDLGEGGGGSRDGSQGRGFNGSRMLAEYTDNTMNSMFQSLLAQSLNVGPTGGPMISSGGGFGGGGSPINLPTITNLQKNKFTVFVDESSSSNNSMKNEIVRRHERNPLSELHNWSDQLLSTLNQFNAIKRIGIDFNNCKVYANSLFSDRKPYYGYIQDRGNVILGRTILKNTGYILFYSGVAIELMDYDQGNQSLVRMGADVSAMIYAARLGGWTGILFGLTYSIGSNELNREPIFGWNSGSRFLSPSDNTNVFINWRK
jgi:hypothetical protein